MDRTRPERLPEALLAALRGAGVEVVTEPGVLAGHAVDWTGHWTGPVLGVVRPDSTSAVRAVLAAARQHAVPVHVQGGRTGLVGGGVPSVSSLVLSTERLDRIGEVDPVESTVRAGAGVPCARVAAAADAAGLVMPVDLASRDTATIGGMAATNAGGLGVIAFGTMRENVRGLVAVLADGRVVDTTGRPRKDNTGFALDALLVGSEGTLAVITEVEVVLHPRPSAATVALLHAASLRSAVALGRMVQARARVLAAEVVDGAGLGRLAHAHGQADPLGSDGWGLLLSVADGGQGAALAGVAEAVVTVGTDAASRSRLWALREGQPELYAQLGRRRGLDKLDVAFRLDDLDAGVAALRTAAARAVSRDGQPVEVGVFGHALDGNLHVQLLGAATGLPDELLALVAERGGSVSAEHGIGRAKVGLLARARGADEVAWMRQIKQTVDPEFLLNRGVLLDPSEAAAGADR